MSFAAEQATADITIAVAGDNDSEGDERFTLSLLAITSGLARLAATDSADGAILNDDPASFSSCTDVANSGLTTDGFYLIGGSQQHCRFNLGDPGDHYRACLYQANDQRDRTCGGVSSRKWAISDGSGRTFLASRSTAMTWPSSGGESVFSASWQQIEPVVSPTTSGSATFCLSSRTYLGGGGRSNLGAFSFANPGSANSGGFEGCVTSLDGGQYFGGHSSGVGEWIDQAGSWRSVNNGDGVLSSMSFYYLD